MKKEDFLKLGVDEETAGKLAEASAEELKGFIPKARFDEVNNELKAVKGTISERDKQLEELKKSSGDNEALKQQIADLQKANKEAQTAHEAEMQKLKIDSAVDRALIEAKAKNIKAVKALLDLEGAEISEDGTIKGLSDKIKALSEAEDSSFLFDTAGNKPGKGFHPGQSKDGLPPSGSDYQARLEEARKNGNTVAAIQIKQEAAAEGVILM